jgi:hypothetical protein
MLNEKLSSESDSSALTESPTSLSKNDSSISLSVIVLSESKSEESVSEMKADIDIEVKSNAIQYYFLCIYSTKLQIGGEIPSESAARQPWLERSVATALRQYC